mgnify:CR=1 FL=1
MFEELREKATENLSHWMGPASYDNREVVRYSDGYMCNEWDSHLEFKTQDIKVALDFLFPA